MQVVILTASLLLVGMMVGRYVEYRANRRICSRARARADRAVLASSNRLRAMFARVHTLINRETVVKVLHMVTYVALACVRFLEARLVGLMRRLRSLRKGTTAKPVSSGLDRVGKTVDSE